MRKPKMRMFRDECDYLLALISYYKRIINRLERRRIALLTMDEDGWKELLNER